MEKYAIQEVNLISNEDNLVKVMKCKRGHVLAINFDTLCIHCVHFKEGDGFIVALGNLNALFDIILLLLFSVYFTTPITLSVSFSSALTVLSFRVRRFILQNGTSELGGKLSSL